MSDLDLHAPDLAPLVQRVERANGDGMAEAARTWASLDETSDLVALRHAGAWIIAGDGESPLARVVGLGLECLPTDAELDVIEAFYLERGQRPRIDLSNYADQDLWKVLAARGYRAVSAENCFARALDAPIDHPTPNAAVRIDVSRLDVNDDEALDHAVGVMARTFQDPPPEWLTRVTRQGVLQPCSETFTASLGGAVVAGACVNIQTDMAALYAGGVLPEKRRCGVHSALIRGRLMWARDSGAKLAFIQGKAGGPTERNARRAGFSILHTKTVLVKDEA